MMKRLSQVVEELSEFLHSSGDRPVTNSLKFYIRGDGLGVFQASREDEDEDDELEPLVRSIFVRLVSRGEQVNAEREARRARRIAEVYLEDR